MIVKAKIENIEKKGGGAKSLGDFFINAGTRPYYIQNVTYNEKAYKIRSFFPGEVGKYVGFDPDSEPDTNGNYLEMGFYDSAE